MAHIKGNAMKMKFTPDGTGGGWLEWDEVLVRKGFRNKVVHRKIYKEAVKAPEAQQ